MRVRDSDLSAFLIYARRELTLDAALADAQRRGAGDDRKQSLEILRDLNKKALFAQTRHTGTKP